MKIAKVYIKNFRSIWELEVPTKGYFKNLVVLIGCNDSGKTNILRALRLALEQLDESTSKNLPIQNPWFFNYEDEPSIIELFLTPDKYESQQILNATKQLEHLGLIYLQVKLFKTDAGVRWELSNLKIMDTTSSKSTVELAKEFYEEVKRRYGEYKELKEIPPSIEIIKDGNVVRKDIFDLLVKIFGKDSNKLMYLCTTKELSVTTYNGREEIAIPYNLRENIRSITSCPPLRRIFIKRLEYVKESYNYSPDASTISYMDEDLPTELFGSGSLAFDAVFASLILAEQKCGESSGIVLIEEPEVHLHPELVREMALLLEEFAERGKLQLFIVTQSPELIDAFYDKSGIIFVKKAIVKHPKYGFELAEPATQAFPLAEGEILTHLSREMGIKMFFSNVLLLVEGGEDESLLRCWIREKRKELTHLRKYSIGIIPFAKKFKRGGLVNLVKTLKERLKIDVFVILDGDDEGMENYKELRDYGLGDIAFHWNEPDILCFIESSMLVDVIQEVFRNAGGESLLSK